MDKQPSKTADLSAFLTSIARFFVKSAFHEKCGVCEACKKVSDFFDTLKITLNHLIESYFLMRIEVINSRFRDKHQIAFALVERG